MEVGVIPPLPMGITKDTPLDQVEILLAFHSAKTGAGKQEITVFGDGHLLARRLLDVKLPGCFRRIALDAPGNYSVEQIIGAVKLAAGLCLPEALNHRFFPNL